MVPVRYVLRVGGETDIGSSYFQHRLQDRGARYSGSPSLLGVEGLHEPPAGSAFPVSRVLRSPSHVRSLMLHDQEIKELDRKVSLITNWVSWDCDDPHRQNAFRCIPPWPHPIELGKPDSVDRHFSSDRMNPR